MIEKYGKELNMRTMKRDMPKIKDMIGFTRQTAVDNLYNIEEDRIICRICGSNHVHPFVSVFDSYHYYECEECNSVFLHNLPDVRKLYDTENSGQEVSANPKVLIDNDTYEQRVKMIAAPKADFVLEVCNENAIKPKTWVDIACGGGDMIYHLSKSMSISVTGVEADGAEVAFCKSKGLNVINQFISTDNENPIVSSLIAESDVVSVMNLVEHVVDPKSFMNAITSKMRKGAVLVVETPRHPSIASFANLTCSNMVYRHIVPPTHLEVFSEKGLSMVIGDSFEVIGKWVFGQGYTDIINNLMLLSGIEENDLYIQIMNLSNKIQPIIDENNLGDQMILVAQKIK